MSTLLMLDKPLKDTKWTRYAHIGGAHTAWTRVSDGRLIYIVHPNGEQPTPTSGGYFRFESALKIKNLNAKPTTAV